MLNKKVYYGLFLNIILEVIDPNIFIKRRDSLKQIKQPAFKN